jgi:pimeloyl-ACP methyl ester carboxylesterase
MGEVSFRTVETNGIRMHLAEQGTGPLVLLCHGWPESWYSWRHQLKALADAGYHAVAPDMRGYGKTDAPDAADQYTQLHMAGDMVGILDALKAPTAVIVGHDWGAPVAWHCALLRPDRFPAVAALSVPFMPPGAVRPTAGLKHLAGEHFMYMLYFQEPGKAETELEADVRRSILSVLYAASGEGANFLQPKPKASKFLDGFEAPKKLPQWLSEADLAFYVAEFQRTGFRGGLNWYRNLDRTWELLAAFRGAKIQQPALYIVGDRDLVIQTRKESVERLPAVVPNLRKLVMLPGCGHWTQQERPKEVNAELIAFLKGLPGW